MTVTKEVLINKIYDEVGLSKATSKKVVEALIELIKESLERGENVLISGFGKFVVREKRPRRGRNPQTGETITISERRVITFRPSKILKDEINKK